MKHSLLLLSLIPAMAQAQIIYTDVIPDAVYNVDGDTSHLDLNNDGTADFLVRFYRSSGNCQGTCALPGARPSWVKIDPLFSNEVADTIAYPSQLDSLELIDMALTWSNTSDQILSKVTSTLCVVGGCLPSPPALGQWWTHLPKYLGLRFNSGGASHFGWARLRVTGYIDSFTLLDYAYNSVPDEFILAGDTLGSISTGIAQSAKASVQVVPNPTNGKFTIEGLDRSRTTSVEIRDAMGQEVHGHVHNSSSSGIDLSSQPNGIYFVIIRTPEKIITRKLVKQ